MKVGDVKLDKTEVRMTLDLGDVGNSVVEMVQESLSGGHQKESNGNTADSNANENQAASGTRSLLQSIKSKLFSRQDVPSMATTLQDRILRDATHLGHGRYLLNNQDQYSIGVVAAEVLASSLDVTLAKKNIELDHISPKEVILTLTASGGGDANDFANGSGAATSDADANKDTSSASSSNTASDSSSAASDAASDSSVHSKGESRRLLRNLSTANTNATRPTNTQAQPNNSRNPAPRRQNRLTVDLEVWGHYPPQLNVDFDYIVQDSINRETESIREELKDYNANCEDQIEKVDDHGFGLDDFEEIHSNKGVTENTRMKRERNAKQQENGEEVGDDDTTMQGGVFRTACSNAVKLPDYFEESLQTIDVKVGAVSILEEPSGTPIMIISLLAALLVVMVIGGFLVFRMGE
jgi:hypothetical protein